MRRDMPVMVYEDKYRTVICRACLKTIGSGIPREPVIKNCTSLFIRKCTKARPDEKFVFDNTLCKIIISIDGTCKLKETESSRCLADNFDCNNCDIKESAIQKYKQNNNLIVKTFL